MNDNLPPLPTPEAWRTRVGPWGDHSTDYAYTVNQMRAYATQAVAERDAEIGRLKAALEKIADLEIEALRAQIKADRDHREILDADPREWGRADEPWIPLYTTPPAPVVPQPLTDEDIHLITGHCGVSKHAAISIARAVEAEVLKRMGVQR